MHSPWKTLRSLKFESCSSHLGFFSVFDHVSYLAANVTEGKLNERLSSVAMFSIDGMSEMALI